MRPQVVVLFVTIFIDLLGFGIIIPILPNLAKDLGAPEASIGVIAACYSIMNFVFSPFWGTLSDRIGRRPVILISVAFTCLSSLLLSFASVIWVLVLQRCLAGIGSANISAANAYIADITDKENRAKNMGLVGAAFGLGFIFGPPIGGYLKTNYGLEGVGIFTAGLCLINLVMAYFMLPESLKHKNPDAKFEFKPITNVFKALKTRIISELFILNFIFIVAFALMQITVAILWKDHYGLDDEQIGYVFAFMGLTSALVQGLLVGRLNKAFGERKLLFAGFIVMACGLFIIPFVPEDKFYLMLVSIALVALANGCVMPSAMSLISQNAGPLEQGKYLGLNQSFGALGRVFGPIIGGVLYHFNFHLPYFVAGCVSLGALYLVNDLLNRKMGPQNSPEAKAAQ